MSHQSSLQTPMARVRHFGSAKSGTQHAWRMRLTSFALLPLTIAFIVLVVMLIGKDFESAHALLASPCPAVLMMLFVGAGAWHMMLGMQIIIEDYVHEHRLKLLALMGNTLFCAVVGLSCVYALLRLSFT